MGNCKTRSGISSVQPVSSQSSRGMVAAKAGISPMRSPATKRADPQQIPQQSGCDAVRARCETMPLTSANHHQDSNEKTPRFPNNIQEKAGFLLRGSGGS